MMDKKIYRKPTIKVVASDAEPLMAASGEEVNIENADRSSDYGAATESIWN